MRTGIALVAILALASAGCASPEGGAAPDEVERLPANIVELARMTPMGGEFVLEVAEDGTILGAEAFVPVERVPAMYREAADRHAPGGKAVGAERELSLGTMYWEVVKEIDGRRVEILMNADGSLAGREDPLKKADWPAIAVKAGTEAAGGGEVVAVETVSGPEAITGETWHVKVKSEGGEVLRVSVRLDGSVVRVVRKIKAEVRVPR